MSDSVEPGSKDIRERGLSVNVEFLREHVGRTTDGLGGAAATRKGRAMVVTRMTCLRSDLSEMPEGRKLTSPSNGRCDGSEGGSNSSERWPRLPGNQSLSKEKIVRAVEEEYVDVAVGGAPLLEHCCVRFGGTVRVPGSSVTSLTPIPPTLRHVRAMRSAHSKTFTKRTAPARSKASGSARRRTRTVGCTSGGMGGGR